MATNPVHRDWWGAKGRGGGSHPSETVNAYQRGQKIAFKLKNFP